MASESIGVSADNDLFNHGTPKEHHRQFHLHFVVPEFFARIARLAGS